MFGRATITLGIGPHSSVKAVFQAKISMYCLYRAPKFQFLGEMSVHDYMLTFAFVTPKRHILAQNRIF